MSLAIWISLAVFAVTYAFIVTEKIPPSTAAVLGGAAVVFFQLIPHEKALEHVDLDVLFLLIGMMTVVGILSETGLFEWVAVMIARLARGRGMPLLIGLVCATAVLSALLDNVTTVVLIVPITILITQILEIPAIPFLILTAIFSNIGGTATLIGDPPNILIGGKSHLNFNDFLFHMTPAVILIMTGSLIAVFLVFRRAMRVKPEARLRILKAHPRRAITDAVKLKRGLPLFFLILIGFAVSHVFEIQPGLVALAGGMLMVIITRTPLRAAVEKVEWETIFFLIGLFMLVAALEYNGLFDLLGGGLARMTSGSLLVGALAMLWVSGVLSAALGAIPVTIALIPLVSAFIAQAGLPAEQAAQADVLWWALGLGACLGGNGTVLGTAANIVVVQIARKNRYHVSFTHFMVYGIPLTLLALLLSSAYLYLRYFLLALY